jgi:VWFA-related protein
MRLRPASFLVLSLILCFSAFLAVSHAQVADPSDDGPVPQVAPHSVDLPQDTVQASTSTLHVTSREVVVDVMVSDESGNPVRGLQRSDFTIEENGKPQPIRGFLEVGSTAPPAEPAPPKLPIGVYTNSQSTPATGPVNILLFDAMHSNAVQIVRGLEAASAYLNTMPQGTKVAVFWLAQSGLHMLQGFTSDRVMLLRAVHNNRTDVGSVQLDQHTRNWLTIDALNQIGAYVAGIKGRKNLLWIAPGSPIPLMRDGGYGWGNGDMSLVHRLMDVYERFTAEQVAVSPVDPRGVVGRMGIAQLRAEAVAEQSGGEAFYNNNDLRSLIAKAIEHGSHFYTISYIPPMQKEDGHYHHIKILLADQPKLHLVYREGYNAERVPTLDAPAPGPALMKASMEGNLPAATQILFDVGVWPSYLSNPATARPQSVPKSKPGKTVLYEIHYGFPPSEIAFNEGEDGMLHGELEFDAAAYDVGRKRVAQQTQTIPSNLSVPEYDEFMAKHAFAFTQQIELPLGEISLHVGILDKVTSKVGTLEIPVFVRPEAPKQPKR